MEKIKKMIFTHAEPYKRYIIIDFRLTLLTGRERMKKKNQCFGLMNLEQRENYGFGEWVFKLKVMENLTLNGRKYYQLLIILEKIQLSGGKY